MVVVESVAVQGPVASLVVAEIELMQVEPKTAGVALDSAPGSRNSWVDEGVLEPAAGPMLVGAEPGQNLEPMDS